MSLRLGGLVLHFLLFLFFGALLILFHSSRLGVLAVGLLVEHPMQADVGIEAVKVGGQSQGEVAVGGGYGLGKHVGRRGSEIQGKARGETHRRLNAHRGAHGNAPGKGLGVAGA